MSKKSQMPPRIPINRDTYELGGDLQGHKLDHLCDAGEIKYARGSTWLPRDFFSTYLEYQKEGADLWLYKSDMPLCGTSGYAIVLGEFVLRYAPIVMH
jgi:hypothetical protein